MILKIIRTMKTPCEIYTHIPYKVDEEEVYHILPKGCEVIIQILKPEADTDVFRAVICGEVTVFIHKDEHAFLLNDEGKTLKIISRP